MTDRTAERIRIEIAFDGSQGMNALVDAQTAEQLEGAVASGNDGAFTFDSEDGRYTVALRHVVYVKRFVSEGRVGFGVG